MYIVAGHRFTTLQSAQSFARDMSRSTGLPVAVTYRAEG